MRDPKVQKAVRAVQLRIILVALAALAGGVIVIPLVIAGYHEVRAWHVKGILPTPSGPYYHIRG
jgi:hypothetical protein